MSVLPEGRWALVIAHPGHELSVYGLLKTARPRVFILTDGSGRSGRSRLESTTTILRDAGASVGSIYGRFSDLRIYSAILEGDFAFFRDLIVEFANAFVDDGINCVAGDAVEGYNPVHDTCRIITNAAVQLAALWSGRRIVNREFLLFGCHNSPEGKSANGSITFTLADELFAEKLAIAREYPELHHEVGAMLDKKMLAALKKFPELSSHFEDAVLKTKGPEAYRVEFLRAVSGSARPAREVSEIPFYERYGELMVRNGVYESAIRYREHLVPLIKSIQRFVADGATSGKAARR